MADTYSSQIPLRAVVIGQIKYDDLHDSAQSLLWRILRYDSTISGTYSTNVLDKVPEDLYRSVGLPLLVVPVPNVVEEIVTMRRKRVVMAFDCEAFTFTTKVQRQFLGAIRKAIRTNISLFGKFRLENAVVNNVNMDFITPDGKTLYRSEITISFEAVIDYVDGT